MLRKFVEDLAQEFDLTKRQTEILHLVTLGLANETIADQLFISSKTVKNHISDLLQKTQTTGRPELLGLVIQRLVRLYAEPNEEVNIAS